MRRNNKSDIGDLFDNSNAPFIFLFNGPPGSGKDTGAEILSRLISKDGTPVKVMKFADPLKNAVHAMCGLMVTADHFEGCKEKPSAFMLGKTPREAYISASEDWAKKFWGTDFFSKILIQRIRQHQRTCKGYVISDCGFQNEVDVLMKTFERDRVIVIKMYREGCDFSNDSRAYVTGDLAFAVENNGTFIDLENKLIGILKFLSLETK